MTGSGANAERLRGFLTQEADPREDPAGVDFSVIDPNVVFEDNVYPDHVGETYRGHQGMARALRTWLEVYGSFTLDLEEIVGSGDRLVSIHRFRGTGRSSGIEQSFRFAYIWTFRNGKVVRFVSFRDPEEALERAGLQE